VSSSRGASGLGLSESSLSDSRLPPLARDEVDGSLLDKFRLVPRLRADALAVRSSRGD